MKLLNIYKNGNYLVKIYDNGTKEYFTENTNFDAAFPDNMDVKITDKCSQLCPFCYEGCSPGGKHSVLFNEDGTPAWEWMKHLHAGTEMAINGNDLDHPQIEMFLKYLRDIGVIVNITVNQRQFEDNYSKLYTWTNHNFVKGIGISFTKYSQDFYEISKWIPNMVIHVIAGVTPISEIRKLAYKNYKLLILGFKHKGRGIDYSEFHKILFEPYKQLIQEMELDEYMFNVVSFDNLALNQLDVKNTLNISDDIWEELYQGDDGTHTFYMDLVRGTYARSSVVEDCFEIGNLTCEEMLYNIKNNN